MRARRIAWLAAMIVAAGCGQSPTAPKNVILLLPGGSSTTPPVIRSITGPTLRREAGFDVRITAVVEDPSPTSAPLLYEWSANVGVITGEGSIGVFRMAPGIQQGVDVVVSLTVVKRYFKAGSVSQEIRVTGQAAPFRVHDSVAEQKELARRFLIDLFGHSEVPPLACLVDFSDVGKCAKGKSDELADITNHRRDYLVLDRRIFSQYVLATGQNTGEVHSDASFIDIRITGNEPPVAQDARGDFWLTTVYEGNRWWLCESYFTPTGNSGLATIKRNRGRTGPIIK